MPESGPAQDAPRVTISEAAVRRVRALAEAEGAQDMMLRVAVGGGGCSGFQYSFSFDDVATEDDSVFERDGVKVVVPISIVPKAVCRHCANNWELILGRWPYPYYCEVKSRPI